MFCERMDASDGLYHGMRAQIAAVRKSEASNGRRDVNKQLGGIVPTVRELDRC